MDLDLSGILQFVFNPLGDLPGQQGHFILADHFGLDDDADLAAGLNGVGFLYPAERRGDLLQFFQALDVVFQVFPPGAGSGGGNGVSGLHQAGDDGLGLYVVVVGVDGMDHLFALLVLPGQLHADGDVGALHLVVHSLAQVVEQAGPLGGGHILPNLGGHKAGQLGHFDGVVVHVLSVAGAVLHATDELDELGVQHGALALGLDGGVHLPLGDFHHLLNAGGVDSAVQDELFQGQPGDLPANWIEAGDGDGLRGVVDDEVHAGEGLQGADIPALPADDPALHLVVGQGHHGHGGLGHVVCGTSLDGQPHDLLGFRVGLLLEAGLHFFDFHGGLVGDLGLQLGD